MNIRIGCIFIGAFPTVWDYLPAFFFCLVTEKAGQTYPDNLSGSVRQFNYITSSVTVRKDQPSGLCLAEALLIDEEVAEKAAGHCNH